MAKRVPDGQTYSEVINDFLKRFDNLTFRIITPVVISLMILGLVLYILVLSSVSNFANRNIKENLEWAAHDIYNICDDNFDELLKSGSAYTEKALRIKTGLTMGTIEDFLRENDFKCLIYLKYNKKIIFESDFDFDTSPLPQEMLQENVVTKFNYENTNFFTYHFQYDPWNWHIILFKDRTAYSGLISNVSYSYMLTGFIIILLALLLSFYLNSTIKTPISRIIKSIKRSRAPVYEGIKEYEFLSKSINEMMKSLYEKNEWINSLISTIGALVVVLDPEGRIFMLNKTFESMTGYTTAEEKGKYLWESFMRDDKDIHAIRGMFGDLNSIQFPLSFEGELITRSDNKIVCYWTNTVITDQDKKIRWIITTGIDITQKERAEEQLRESEEKYRLLVETMNEGLAVQDENGKFTFVNSRFCRMVGYTSEEMIGKPSNLFFDRENAKILGGELVKIKNNINELFEITWKTKDDRKVTTIVSPMSLQDRDGVFRGYVSVVADISERKKLEEELIKARKLESIGILAGGIAHDFNNILTGIIGNINLAKIYVDSNDTVSELLAEAEKVAFKAKDLTQQLLTFSKGGAPIKVTDSISELIKDTSIFALRGSNIKCLFDIPGDLWLAEFDSGQISQVINNIVINAKQAMPKGGMLEISAENIDLHASGNLPLKPGKYIKISIADRGIGIPEDNLPKIFDPYFSTKEKGSGLGLASSYSIIKRHGGYIFAESEYGEGTTLTFYLPATVNGNLPEEEYEKRELKGKGRILLMDDEEIILSTIGNMLHHIGYKVDKAHDGLEAIDKYEKGLNRKSPYNAVIIDLTIPGGMGGKETIEKLLEIDPDIRAIVSSGYSNDDIMSNYRNYGFKGVIVKPYDIQKLNDTLTKVFEE